MREQQAEELRRGLDQAAAIVPHLGAGWSVKRPDRETDGWYSRLVTLEGPGAARLHLQFVRSTSRKPARLVISPLWPRRGTEYYAPRNWLPYGEANPVPEAGIVLTADRPPIALARDISRRLLAPYLPMLARAERYMADQDAERAAAIQTGELVAGLLGRPLTRNERAELEEGKRTTLYLSDSDRAAAPWLDCLEVEPDASVKLLLRRMPRDVAMEMIARLRPLRFSAGYATAPPDTR